MWIQVKLCDSNQMQKCGCVGILCYGINHKQGVYQYYRPEIFSFLEIFTDGKDIRI